MVIIIATYNGGEILRRTLEAYCQQDAPQRPWRLIVVDNNSSDNTPEILRYFCRLLPLVIVSAAKQGKNSALNEALNHLSPDDNFIIFSDDDAIPDKNYLCAWEKVASKFLSYDLFAGRVDPYFLAREPIWLSHFKNSFDVLYAKNVRPDGEIEACEVFGPNMAVRRSVFSSGLRFNEAIGPNSSDPDYPMGSETEFCVRAALVLNAKTQFVSKAKVAHQIRPHQMEMPFILGRAYRHGRGLGIQHNISMPHLRSSVWKLRVRVLWHWLWSTLGIRQALWYYHWWRGYLSSVNNVRNKA